jgi:hypothetical protein
VIGLARIMQESKKIGFYLNRKGLGSNPQLFFASHQLTNLPV